MPKSNYPEPIRLLAALLVRVRNQDFKRCHIPGEIKEYRDAMKYFSSFQGDIPAREVDLKKYLDS